MKDCGVMGVANAANLHVSLSVESSGTFRDWNPILSSDWMTQSACGPWSLTVPAIWTMGVKGAGFCKICMKSSGSPILGCVPFDISVVVGCSISVDAGYETFPSAILLRTPEDEGQRNNSKKGRQVKSGYTDAKSSQGLR